MAITWWSWRHQAESTCGKCSANPRPRFLSSQTSSDQLGFQVTLPYCVWYLVVCSWWRASKVAEWAQELGHSKRSETWTHAALKNAAEIFILRHFRWSAFVAMTMLAGESRDFISSANFHFFMVNVALVIASWLGFIMWPLSPKKQLVARVADPTEGQGQNHVSESFFVWCWTKWPSFLLTTGTPRRRVPFYVTSPCCRYFQVSFSIASGLFVIKGSLDVPNTPVGNTLLQKRRKVLGPNHLSQRILGSLREPFCCKQ